MSYLPGDIVEMENEIYTVVERVSLSVYKIHSQKSGNQTTSVIKLRLLDRSGFSVGARVVHIPSKDTGTITALELCSGVYLVQVKLDWNEYVYEEFKNLRLLSDRQKLEKLAAWI